VIPGGFAVLLWQSYRRERKQVASGRGGFAPPGKERW
jgi:hypothetical protein